MDRCFATSIDLDELARVAGVSTDHFPRCFEATYGETPIRYLTRRRIERAKDLLRVATPSPRSARRFVQERADRPYGVDAVKRDNSGNWLVLAEPTESQA